MMIWTGGFKTANCWSELSDWIEWKPNWAARWIGSLSTQCNFPFMGPRNCLSSPPSGVELTGAIVCQAQMMNEWSSRVIHFTATNQRCNTYKQNFIIIIVAAAAADEQILLQPLHIGPLIRWRWAKLQHESGMLTSSMTDPGRQIHWKITRSNQFLSGSSLWGGPQRRPPHGAFIH